MRGKPIEMLKVLLVCSICMLAICRSATLQETLQTHMENIIVNGVNMGLSRLKEEYQQKIRQLKTEATSCVINGNCTEILRKIEVSCCIYCSKLKHFGNINNEQMNIYRFGHQNLKKGFYQEAEQLKTSEKRMMQLNHRQNNIRCIDCIADYIDDIFSDFCGEMDEELAPNILVQIMPSSNQPPNATNVTSTNDVGGNETKTPSISLNNSTNATNSTIES